MTRLGGHRPPANRFSRIRGFIHAARQTESAYLIRCFAIARQTRRLVPPLDAVSPGEDIAVFTSGRPDFATCRLMQGFGLRVV